VNPGGYTPGAAGQETAEPGTAGQDTGGTEPPYAGYQTFPSYPSPYQNPFTPPTAGFTDPAAPPTAPVYWRHHEPIGAIVLIALGTLFLLSQLDIFHGRLLEFAWPIMLIALGIWLIVRRLGNSQGGSK
jgi:hypothetical protein